MRQIIIIFLALISVCESAIAQNSNTIRTQNWVAGALVQIPTLFDFSEPEPQIWNQNLPGIIHEPISTISDLEGELLFHSNGLNVINRNHEIMPNGSGLLGGISSINGCIIAPKPGSDSLYYVFYNPGFEEDDLPQDYQFAIVDLSLDDGLGDVIEKNSVFCENSTEGMVITQHSNGVDYWVVVAPDGDDIFKSYLLSENGILENPVVSSAGIRLSGRLDFRISPTNCHIAIGAHPGGFYGVYSFNAESGEITNPMLFEGELSSSGNCFSPDGSKLYVGVTSEEYLFEIRQYSMDYQDYSDLESSMFVVFDNISTNVLSMQINPYGQIYVSNFLDGFWTIPTPNLSGADCGIDSQNFMALSEDIIRFPLFPETWLNVENIPMCIGSNLSSGDSEKNLVSVYPNPTSGTLFIDLPDYLSVDVINLVGEQVSKTIIQNGQVDLKNLDNGIYYLRLSESVVRVMIH